MNATDKLFTESGRPKQGDNRNYFVKALNSIIEDGFISIKIQEKGLVWYNPCFKNDKGQDRPYNIVFKGYGCTGRYYLRDFNAKDLLVLVANFIQFPKVAEMHKKNMEVHSSEVCTCDRCNGHGFVKAFDYYCNGICFKCYGSGHMVTKKILSV